MLFDLLTSHTISGKGKGRPGDEAIDDLYLFKVWKMCCGQFFLLSNLVVVVVVWVGAGGSC